MPKKIIEAALFMSSRPMKAEEISKITDVPVKAVEERLEELRREYDGESKGVEIVKDPEGWGMRVKPGLLPKVAHLTPYSDLKDGHKRTLALVAYKEPIRQSEIIRIQGNKAYSYIKRLMKKGLIKSEKQGRTRILMLTQEFERYFGEERQRIKEMLEQGVSGAEEKEAPGEGRPGEGKKKSEEKPGGKDEETTEGDEENGEDEEKTYSDLDQVIPFGGN